MKGQARDEDRPNAMNPRIHARESPKDAPQRPRDTPGRAASRTDSEHAGTAATLGQVRAVAQFG